MGKAALPSLAASLLLHLVLSFGIGPSLHVRRAPLLPSRPMELELEPLETLPEAAPLEDVSGAGAVAERALPALGSSARAAEPPAASPVLPARATEPPSSKSSATESPSSESPSSAELAAVPASNEVAPPVESPSAALPPSGGAVEPSAVEPSAVEPSAVARVAESGVAGPAAPALGGPGAPAARGASPGSGGTLARGPGEAAALQPRARDGSDAERQALREAYLQQLRQRVLGRRVYPYLARRARLEGTVCLRVSLDGQGNVVRLSATCAAPEPLREAAFLAVRTAAPYGPLPSSLGGALTVDIPMVFQLEAM